VYELVAVVAGLGADGNSKRVRGMMEGWKDGRMKREGGQKSTVQVNIYTNM
jgi:hypothetical protein